MNIDEQLNETERTTPLPLPLPTLPEVQKFDPDMLPDSIRDYILDVADRQQSPPDFVAVTAICALASIVGRKVQIMPKQFDDWTITLTQWGTIIGRPSAMKSPSMKEALKPLLKIEAEAAEQYEKDLKKYFISKEIAEIDKEAAKLKAKKMAKDGDRQGAFDVLSESEFNESPPTRSRIIINDATIEKLGELLNENTNGLLLVRDELSGWLSKLSKEEYQSDRAFYLECFDGNGRYIYDRIGRGTIEIKNCTLSIIGGIQPSKIRPLLRDAINGTVDDGLIQRLQLAVWPDDVGNWIWKDREPDKLARTNYYNAFFKLRGLHLDEAITTNPRCLRFTPIAQNIFIKWMEIIQLSARTEGICPALESHLLKMPKTISGLALLIELIDGGHEAVGELAITKAIKWAGYLKSHAERLYSIAMNESLEGAHLILKRKNKLPSPFTIRDIQRKGWAGLDGIKIISEALEYLLDYHHITAVEIPPSENGGRPTIHYYWNQ